MRGVLAVSVLLLTSASQSAVPGPAAGHLIATDTAGGDAWTFDHLTHGRVAERACDSVTVQSPSGSATALLTGNTFFASIHLWSGENRITAQCWKDRMIVATASQHWNVRLKDGPRAWARLRVENDTVHLDAGGSEPASGRPAPIVGYEWAPLTGNPAPLPRVSGKQVAFTPPAIDGVFRVILRVTDGMGRSDASITLFRVSHGRPVAVDVDFARPAWLEGAVLYGLPLKLLRPVGFEGARARLDKIAELGATVIWLSPMTEASPGDFGYAVTDQFRLRREFGTEGQLHALIDAAHARGLKVMVDFVSNHLSAGHRYFRDSQDRGAGSAYYDWFERDNVGKSVHYFDWSNLENLNYDNPDVRGFISCALTHWVQEYHVDGFRLDAAWAVRDRAPDFWPGLRRELKRLDPDVVLLAEASERDPYYATRGFDAVYDWSERLGEWAWEGVFGRPNSIPDLVRLRRALQDQDLCSGTERRPLVVHFLNNNDTGLRFVTRHGLGQTKDAAALLLTLPGLPMIYAGDEVGATYEPYGGVPIAWSDASGLEPFYARLIRLRRDTHALRSGCLRLLKTDHDDAVLAFLRAPVAPDRPVLVAINFASSPVDVRLQDSEVLHLGPYQFTIVPH
jgi:cyclomaltodextrinase